LTDQLDQNRRWDRVLPEDDQQRLALARVLLLAPRWLVIDEVLDTLDEATLARVSAAFAGDLVHTAIIHIGRGGAAAALFPRVLHLVDDPSGRRLGGPPDDR
jgi:putative ATP-binding cassette transporter